MSNPGLTIKNNLQADQAHRDLLYELNEVLRLEGGEMDWVNRARLTHVSSSLHRLWSAAG